MITFQIAENYPGFRYSQDELSAMHSLASKVSRSEFRVFTLATTLIFIVIAAANVTLAFISLLAIVKGDTANTPAALFFFFLGTAAVSSICGGLPIAMLVASWFTAKIYPPQPATLPRPEFAQTLFRKVAWQVIRMGLIMSAVMIAYCVFVPTGSKFDLFVRGLLPFLGWIGIVLSIVARFAQRAR